MSSPHEDINAPMVDALSQVADCWRATRGERQERTHLDPGDLDDVRDSGFLRSVVPVDHGGGWMGAAASVDGIARALRVLAAADPSIALVSSMHPAVLSFWLTPPESDDARWQRQRRAVMATGLAGQRWGTITSEPGSGGDILRTRAVAKPDDRPHPLPGQTYTISGVKHFGSGLGMDRR